MKSFQGLEQDLINSVTSQQRIDNTLQESVNRGPKEEGEMLLRYMPVHVLLAEEGAVYWGVAKIGIDTNRMRQMLLIQSQEQTHIRRNIWVEIILSLFISGVLAMSLIYFWVRHITEPLRTLSMVTAALKGAKPDDFDLWLENLKRVDAQGQAEVVVIQEVLERLGTAVPKLGQRLIDGEAQACLGKVIARGLPVFQAWQAQLAALEQELGHGEATGPTHQTLTLVRARIDMVFDDLSHLWSDPKDQWDRIDVTPGLQRAWRLASIGLPAEVTQHVEFAPLPPVWGSEAKLTQAALYLLAFAVDLVPPAGELGIKAEPSPAGGIRLTVWVSGNPRSVAECQGWLNPFGDPDRIRGSLGPALAAAIASQHGGSFTVAPREPGGAVFSLELPPLSASQEPHEPVI
jgi:signal transduction histidine kinase